MHLRRQTLCAGCIAVLGIELSACSGAIHGVVPAAQTPLTASPQIRSAYTNYKYQTIDEPHLDETHIEGMNNLGKLTGFYGAGGKLNPVRGFAVQPPYLKYIGIHYPGALDTYATCLSDTKYIGGYFLTTLFGGKQTWIFIYGHGLYNLYRDHKGPAGLDELLGINDSYEGVGFYEDASGNLQPFELKWRQNTFVALHPPHATSSVASGINNKGNMTGWQLTKSGSASSWVLINGLYTEFSFPKAASTEARSINWSNQVAGDYVDASGVTHGFIVSDVNLPLRRVWQTIDEPKANGYTIVTSINLHHDIAGTYKDSRGKYHGFVGTAPNR